ncbi:response regulator transcription factor [Dasania marina]|uniref:response regulator transcription factor n=1 Tax=Dasania marina TaxID=471499 RepID=UPI00036EA7B2|nr:helix-turn-helix transcriptional regulator [Dasania marina]
MNSTNSNTQSLFNRFSHHAAELVASTGNNDFSGKLINMLKVLTAANDGTIFVYLEGKMPTVEYFDPPDKGGSINLDIYSKGAFLLDPYYLAGFDKQYGCFSLKELAPNAFKKTEYYNTYFRLSGVHDECGYVLPIGDNSFVNISLNKTTNKDKFYKKDVNILKDILPFIQSITTKHWGNGSNDAPASHKNLRKPLQSALDCFGNSILTERESQVINKVLRGYSTKAMAEKLSISNETVKLHKKHAYAKLDINSQSELFHLFLDSLMSVDEYKGGDTLSDYL